jgi:hypothetical protein
MRMANGSHSQKTKEANKGVVFSGEVRGAPKAFDIQFPEMPKHAK